MYLDRMRAKAEGGRRVEGRGWRVEGRRRGEVSMKSETRAWKRPKKYGTAGSEGQGWFGWFDFQVDQCWAGQGLQIPILSPSIPAAPLKLQHNKSPPGCSPRCPRNRGNLQQYQFVTAVCETDRPLLMLRAARPRHCGGARQHAKNGVVRAPSKGLNATEIHGPESQLWPSSYEAGPARDSALSASCSCRYLSTA